MTRRRLLNWFLGTSVGTLLVAISYPALRFLTPPEVAEASSSQVEAGRTNDPELLEKGFKIVRFGEDPAIVIRVAEDDFRAFSLADDCGHPRGRRSGLAGPGDRGRGPRPRAAGTRVGRGRTESRNRAGPASATGGGAPELREVNALLGDVQARGGAPPKTVRALRRARAASDRIACHLDTAVDDELAGPVPAPPGGSGNGSARRTRPPIARPTSTVFENDRMQGEGSS